MRVCSPQFGEVGIDDTLLKMNAKFQTEEDIYMMNGCICCTVRQDLVAVLVRLAERAKAGTLELDAIVIETTGLADPAPVAQSTRTEDRAPGDATRPPAFEVRPDLTVACPPLACARQPSSSTMRSRTFAASTASSPS